MEWDCEGVNYWSTPELPYNMLCYIMNCDNTVDPNFSSALEHALIIIELIVKPLKLNLFMMTS